MKLVLALGGNALGNTPAEQLSLVKGTAKAICGLIEQGHQVIIGHGNGPQVGMINSVFETARKQSSIPAMPFPECGAMSQGYIGYHLAQAIRNELESRNIKKGVACVMTQVEVNNDDHAFKNPAKPIGSFMTKKDADEIASKTGYTFIEDSGRGYRRVVPSPVPRSIIEIDTINSLIDSGNVVITVGGGGIPVVKTDNGLIGVAAVIDKDMSCSLLAREVKADMLIILTAVDYVYINYGKDNQQRLEAISLNTATQYIEQGQFGKGSMLPKVIACTEFARSGGKAVITSLGNAANALNSGTVISK